MAEMTVADAAVQWEAAKRAIAKQTPLLKVAEDVVKEYFRKSGKTTYKATIGYQVSTYRQLDTTLARVALGKKAAECEVERSRETLSLLIQ